MPNKKVSLLKSEKGAIPVIAIVVGVVVLAAVGGYLFLTKSDKGAAMLAQNAPGAASALLNEKCQYNDPDLCKFMNSWSSMSDFRVKSTMTEKGQKMESLYEIQGTGKSHMVTSTGGKESYNTITIDNTMYTKDYSDNKWWKQVLEKPNEDLMKEYKMDFDAPEASIAPDTTKYNKIGKEACGSLQCFKYEVMEPTEGVVGDKQFIWFDDKEYKLRKMRLETNEGISEMEYSYDGISIQAPSPIKEAKPGEMIAPGVGAFPQMTEEEKKQYEDALKKSKEMQKDLPTNDAMYEEDNSSSYDEDYPSE